MRLSSSSGVNWISSTFLASGICSCFSSSLLVGVSSFWFSVLGTSSFFSSCTVAESELEVSSSSFVALESSSSFVTLGVSSLFVALGVSSLFVVLGTSSLFVVLEASSSFVVFGVS